MTATQHDISTKLEYTTEFITTTATNTFPVVGFGNLSLLALQRLSYKLLVVPSHCDKDY